MPNDDTEDFRRDVRAALDAAGRPADLPLDVARRLLSWMRTIDGDGTSVDADLDGVAATEVDERAAL